MPTPLDYEKYTLLYKELRERCCCQELSAESRPCIFCRADKSIGELISLYEELKEEIRLRDIEPA